MSLPAASRLLLACCLAGLMPGVAGAGERLAQADSSGGSIGGSLGGSVDAPVPAHRRTLRVEPEPPVAHAPRATHAAPARRPAAARAGGGTYDGAWSVSSGGGCSASGNSQVTIAGGRVISQGGTGRVGPGGEVSTMATINGLTVIGHGRIVGGTASGTYRQSDGCSGPWSAVRL